MCGRLRQATVLALVWLLCLGVALGCAVAVFTFSEVIIQVQQGPSEGGRLALKEHAPVTLEAAGGPTAPPRLGCSLLLALTPPAPHPAPPSHPALFWFHSYFLCGLSLGLVWA